MSIRPAYAGRIDNAIWAHFGDGHLYRAGGELRGNDVALRVRPPPPPLELPVARVGWAVATARKRDQALHSSRLRAERGRARIAAGPP
ncbi:hypothetical protein, partial [Burkholderia pseudomallei]|uniref:hypothetical protein n=1 Tax=Burkholderia pseudomallei TaxID=28450 RepID=UPI00215664D3